MGLKYTSSFDSIRNGNSRYVVNIYQDSYTGDPINYVLASTPVIQEWQEDDPLAPIKGSTLTINLITTGTLFLLDFYSDNDNEFRVELLGDDVTGTQITLFKGFIQQDDSSEVQIDFVHEITLTATDNLGTIKDINLGRAAELFGDLIAVGGIPCAFVPGTYIVIDWGADWPVRPGQTFTVGGFPFTMVTNLGEIDPTYDGWCIQVVENIPSVPPGTLAISYKEIQSLDGYIPLMTFIKLCLRSTYIQNMGLNVYNHITPSDGEIFVDTFQTRIFEDVTVLGNTFLKNNEYMSCYEVLEIIMKRFNMSCFQSLGSWWIVRYPDLFLDFEEGETIIGYYNYNSDFDYVDLLTINKSFVIATNGYVETGLLKSIIRPYRRTLETFNYVQPESLICNNQFDILGSLISTYPDGDVTIYNYTVPEWTPELDGNIFIRQVFNSSNEEIERFCGTDTFSKAKSCNITLSKDDTFELSFEIRASDNRFSGYFDLRLSQMVRITDGTTVYFLKNDGSWTTTFSADNLIYTINEGDNAFNWHSVSFQTQRIPFDCILNIYLVNAWLGTGDGVEWYYRNVNIRLGWVVGGQLNTIGHTHNASQSRELNNINDVQISIDNTLRSTISGTLFLTSQTGLLQNRCTTWEFGSGYNTGFPGKVYDNLGQQITETYMFQRYKPRTKFNGNLLYIRNQNGLMSNLAIFSNEFAGDLYHNKMLFGSLAIDYKNDSAEFTMWEVFNKDLPLPANNFEVFTNYLYNILYQFNYLYENN
jgi:hypothetical protein